MAQITVGEDIFSTLIAVGLISTFVLVLSQSYSFQKEREELQEDLSLTLVISDHLKNEMLCRSGSGVHPGVICRPAFQENLPRFCKLLARKGLGLRVEILTLNREPLLLYGVEPRDFARSISIPVVFQDETRRRPARMNVWTWKR
ncbi:hypothetical protein AKJ45_02020 [candidate division MSBL1 archaeon SCGC-AAA261F19]|uniref:Uncharacterized protein n=2 Tax=candidate division MSBL1 TaxID=215777 RepID=A0A133VA02_9EURY|nr:hypothetical protein AKJ43_01840 [candidate division MSBL1 archaeon SCGC-AAA261D19]KXB03280.1 hypothetical protein AKJ45_02020 [candidate division MSBL1 archaeon SCGC-AAA261F19]